MKEKNEDSAESVFDSQAGDRISSTFCVLPWMHRFTNIGGEVQVCCVSEEFDTYVLNVSV